MDTKSKKIAKYVVVAVIAIVFIVALGLGITAIVGAERDLYNSCKNGNDSASLGDNGTSNSANNRDKVQHSHDDCNEHKNACDCKKNRNNKKAFKSDNSVANAIPQGKGEVVIEQSSMRILYQNDANSKRYPASTTKVLTCLIALENLELSDVVIIKKEAVGVEGSSLYLKEGDEYTVEDLLYGLMLRSGNDCAHQLALEVAGSIDKFSIMMNEKAKSLGALNSNFTNPHGLHDLNHYSTALDLALITANAYNNSQFREISKTKVKKLSTGVAIANKNKMLALYEGGNGVKTGYTKDSGRCLISGAKRDGMQLISVVLNCPDMWEKSTTIFDNSFGEYYMCPIENSMLFDINGELKKEIEAKPIENDTNNGVSEKSNNKNYSIIDIEVKLSKDGKFEPFSYPLKRDGSERLNIIIK